eukprot:6188453-Pleurochrysis_carterae.AAC.5
MRACAPEASAFASMCVCVCVSFRAHGRACARRGRPRQTARLEARSVLRLSGATLCECADAARESSLRIGSR